MLREFKEIYNFRELLFSLTIREIKVRYKQTVLGVFWAIFQPLLMMVVFTIVFSKFAKMPSDGIPYPIFSYSALLPWTFFATSLNFAIPSLVKNSNIVTKIYFPREIFPISSVLAAMVDFIAAGFIFLLMLFLFKIQLTLNFLYIFPIILIQIIFTMSIALFFSALNIYYRDIRYALPFIIQVWMYACPVIYPFSMVPERFRFYYMLNPMAVIIDNCRMVMIKGHAPDFNQLALASLVSLMMFFFSYKYFKKVEITFADII